MSRLKSSHTLLNLDLVDLNRTSLRALQKHASETQIACVIRINWAQEQTLKKQADLQEEIAECVRFAARNDLPVVIYNSPLKRLWPKAFNWSPSRLAHQVSVSVYAYILCLLNKGCDE